jgi:hypothetical protein
MLKIKTLLPVFAMVLVLGLSNAAFAQLSCNVASTPVSRATDTGLTEQAGDVIFNCTFGGTATTSATMTIDYGVPITNSTSYPSTTTGVRVTPGTGAPPSVFSVANATGQVVINIPPQTTDLSFTVTGALLGISGSGKTSVTANVSVSPGAGVLITAGQTNAVVITSVLAGIKAPHLPTGGSPGLILGPGTTVPSPGGGFSILIDENYIDMFRSAAQFNNGNSTNGVQLLLTFTGIPAGVTFSGGTSTTDCTLATTSGSVGFISTNHTLTSTTNTIVLEIQGTPSGAQLDTVTLGCPNANVSSTATLPLTPGTVTMTVTLAPTGTAFSSTGAVLTSSTAGQIPRYTATQIPSPALVVANIIPAATDMLFPFVSINVGGFDTGFAIGNTTGDPFGGTANGGARAQNGTIAMYFFPLAGNPFCIVTGGTATNPVTGGTGATNCTVLTGTTGLGLSAGGVVNAGNSWVVLGSEILRNAAGSPATFQGYVFGVANFSNAHPAWFVADAAFAGKFASGGAALVLAPPQVVTRTGVGGVESLGH